MRKNNFYHKIVQSRADAIVALIKMKEDTARIEREIALLALDTIYALRTKSISTKEGCRCFVMIQYALTRAMSAKLSEEARDLLNEGILLEEAGTPYGSDIALMLRLASGILERDRRLYVAKAKVLVG
ncbi:MAG: hypothetical protein WAP52_00350 [Candidatus Sungiibacteriota bacterium]